MLQTLPDSYRQSMQLYGSRLRDALPILLAPEEELLSRDPWPAWTEPRVIRYWIQYVQYPIQLLRVPADLWHILDHAYGHLAWSLDPRRVVVTVHDTVALKTRRGFVQRYNLSGIRRAAHVICDSEATRREFLHLSGYPSERTTVIYLGVGEEFFLDSTGNPFGRLGIPPGRYVLHIGHTLAYKNIPGLLRVFSILTRELGLDLRLLRVGGPFSVEQNRIARDLGVYDRILHRGFLASDQLPDLYRCAELLLFPSLDEGFGFPVLEAMASGLPVVCSNRGALPEVTEEAALLADPADAPALARHVRDLLQNSALRARLREMGRQRARQFTWEKTAQKTLKLYQQVYQANSDR